MHIYFNAEGQIKLGKNKKMTWDAKTMLPLSRAAVLVAWLCILVVAEPVVERQKPWLRLWLNWGNHYLYYMFCHYLVRILWPSIIQYKHFLN